MKKPLLRKPRAPITKQFIVSNCDFKNAKRCWNWLGALNKLGRAVIRTPEKSIETLARVVWKLYFGQIPTKLHILHRCDNPQCCNPRHLFLGTPKINNLDCVSKGRKPAGEKHGNAVLTNAQVVQIRISRLRHSELARIYGVRPLVIMRARRAETYKNLAEAK